MTSQIMFLDELEAYDRKAAVDRRTDLDRLRDLIDYEAEYDLKEEYSEKELIRQLDSDPENLEDECWGITKAMWR